METKKKLLSLTSRNASLGSTCHKGIGIGDRVSEGDLGFRIGIDFFFCWDRGSGIGLYVFCFGRDRVWGSGSGSGPPFMICLLKKKILSTSLSLNITINWKTFMVHKVFLQLISFHPTTFAWDHWTSKSYSLTLVWKNEWKLKLFFFEDWRVTQKKKTEND